MRHVDKKCGNCKLWMRSTQCPREKHRGGISRGPHCHEPSCSEYVSDQPTEKQTSPTRTNEQEKKP